MQKLRYARIDLRSLVVLAAFFSTTALAQYKYIGPDGRVVYSDTPPPPAAKTLQKPGAGPASSGTSGGLPYALQQAAKNFPVTLYTTKDCDACNRGRSMLGKRGIPFTEKTVGNADDFKVFKDTTGASQVPVMTLGSNKQVGFEEDAWNGALNAAGYPATSLLPTGFKNPAAAPAAPFTPESKTAAAPTAPPGQDLPATSATGGASAPTGAAPPPSGGSRPPSWFKGF